MPSTRIETGAGWIGDRHEALISAVQAAIIEGIRVPEHDRDIRVLEYPPHAFAPPPGRGPHYTVIEITLFTGRTLDAKRRLFAALARELSAFGVGPSDLKVYLVEVARENWGLQGKSAVDIELGFKVEV